MLVYQGYLQMTMLSNKKNKPINVNSRASRNIKIKPRQSIKKTNNQKNNCPSEEFLDLARIWDDGLCE